MVVLLLLLVVIALLVVRRMVRRCRRVGVVGHAALGEGEMDEKRERRTKRSGRVIERRGRDVEGTTRKKRLFRSCGDPIVGLSGVDHRVSRLSSSPS